MKLKKKKPAKKRIIAYFIGIRITRDGDTFY